MGREVVSGSSDVSEERISRACPTIPPTEYLVTDPETSGSWASPGTASRGKGDKLKQEKRFSHSWMGSKEISFLTDSASWHWSVSGTTGQVIQVYPSWLAAWNSLTPFIRLSVSQVFNKCLLCVRHCFSQWCETIQMQLIKIYLKI